VGNEMLSMKIYFGELVFVDFLVALAIILWPGVSSFLIRQEFAEISTPAAHINKVLDRAVIMQNAKRLSDLVGSRLIFSRIRFVLYYILADGALMQGQVWRNLISALKYIRKVESANLEIGSYSEKNDAAFNVKAYEVGFEMTYSHKLFNVFQRLNKVQNFEGMGVGLAIVYRVVIKNDAGFGLNLK
jgi:light-regulated signal transduction histidine kinase (bacteriophytochrome)